MVLSSKQRQIEQITQEVASPREDRMVYLRLILTHSKGQNQGHPNFDCEYLVNGDR